MPENKYFSHPIASDEHSYDLACNPHLLNKFPPSAQDFFKRREFPDNMAPDQEFRIRSFYNSERARTEYNKFYDALHSAVKAFDKANAFFLSFANVTVEFIHIDLRAIFTEVDWSKPRRALRTIKKVRKQIPTESKISKLSLRAEKEIFSDWIDTVLNSLPEGTTYVIIKNNFNPKLFEVNKFDEAVNARSVIMLRNSFGKLQWLGCPRGDLVPILLENFEHDGLRPKDTIVIPFVDEKTHLE